MIVAPRGINKRSQYKVDIDSIDDNYLVEAIKENSTKIKIPQDTKKKLIKCLIDNNINLIDKNTKDLIETNENFVDFQQQLDRKENKCNQMSDQTAAVSSIGKIAAFLSWDIKFKLDMNGFERTIAIISAAVISFFILDFAIFLTSKFLIID
ncbi:unnamed protein product [Brachionus calyciflorus]|uniref:Uncharacterized protein n=1 Tax=Brachionus calyciflorus TaxID=104777 RepID=A0A813Z9P1_9BILA|nr:unnamed protein product [Brachionus calyciflorus]